MLDNLPSPLLINKPVGPTSFGIISQLRKIIGIRKVGHAGTLDPLADGLLLILVGKHCKNQEKLQGLDKEYLAEVTFGSSTTTYDREGELVHTAEQSKLQKLSRKQVIAGLKHFTGQQKQTIPAFSAKKVHGAPLYRQARKGTLDLKILPVHMINIYSLKLLHFTPATNTTPPKTTLAISCSKGTYVRSLAHDLGNYLHVYAHLSALTRTKIGPYELKNAITVAEFAEKWQIVTS